MASRSTVLICSSRRLPLANKRIQPTPLVFG